MAIIEDNNFSPRNPFTKFTGRRKYDTIRKYLTCDQKN